MEDTMRDFLRCVMLIVICHSVVLADEAVLPRTGQIEDLSAQFTNRDALAHSRKLDAECLGVSIGSAELFISSEVVPPDELARLYESLFWSGGQAPDATLSATSVGQWLLQRFPMAEIRILLDERINVYPGKRCWDWNGLGEVPLLGSGLKWLLGDAPAQPAVVKYLEQGRGKYIGVMMNQHREGVQMAWTWGNTLTEALGTRGGSVAYARLNAAQPRLVAAKVQMGFVGDSRGFNALSPM